MNRRGEHGKETSPAASQPGSPFLNAACLGSEDISHPTESLSGFRHTWIISISVVGIYLCLQVSLKSWSKELSLFLS